MPRCQQVDVVDNADFGFWHPSWQPSVDLVNCMASADAVVIIKHEGSLMSGPHRSKWRLCTSHTVEALDPTRQETGDRVKVIPTTRRGVRVLGCLA